MDEHIMSSRRILKFNYIPDEKVLKVVFNHGMTYLYSNVPDSIYDALKKSRDPSLFFDKKIYGHYTLLGQHFFHNVRDYNESVI